MPATPQHSTGQHSTGQHSTGQHSTGQHGTSAGAPAGTPGGPLAGLLAVDLTRALAGPQAAMMLADLGARVIKVETPGTGDDTRGWGPPFMAPANPGQTCYRDDALGPDGESTYFLSCNRNKDSIALDLKSDDGRAVLTELIRRADVLLENFRTGVLERLGFAAEALFALNPRLIVLSISGFGHDGPEGGRAGYDQIAQGEAGLMSLTGPGPDEPQRVGVPIADLLAGMYGVTGVLAALVERERTGVGQVVRTSLLAAVVGVHAFQGTRWTVAGEVGRGQGNSHPSICPYGLFRCADGSVQIAVGSEGLWRRLCEGFDLEADRPGFATNRERVSHRMEVTAHLEAAFAGWNSVELLQRLAELGVPAGRVRTIDQVYDWDQTRSQHLLIDVDHQRLGPITLPGPPLRFFDATGVEVGRSDHTAPPTLDQHGAQIRRWLGLVTAGAKSPSE